MATLRLLESTIAIPGEARLALNTDRPTEHGNIILKEYQRISILAGAPSPALIAARAPRLQQVFMQ